MAGTVSIDRMIQRIEFEIKDPAKIRSIARGFDNINKTVKRTEKQVKESTKAMSAAVLQFGFTALFGGMALKRLGTTIMRSLVETFMRATDEQNIFFQKLQGVNAAFEFLKFAIFDALSQSELVLSLIDGFIALINWTSAFVSQHPLVAKIFVAFAIGGIVLGSVATTMGQLALATLGFVAAGTIAGGIAAWFRSKWFRALLFLEVAWWAITGRMLAFFAAAKVATLAFLTNPWSLLIIAILLAISALFILGKAMGGTWEFIKNVARGALNAFVLLGNYINDTLLGMVEKLLRGTADIAEFFGNERLATSLRQQANVIQGERFFATEAARFTLGAIAKKIPQEVSEDEFKENLAAQFAAFKEALGLAGGTETPTNISVDSIQNIEINVGDTGDAGLDVDALEGRIREGMKQSNEEFLEEQIVRLEGTVRGVIPSG